MQGQNAHKWGGGQIQIQYRRGVRGSIEAIGIRLATLNIRSGSLGGLEAALLALKQGNVDVGVLQDMKLTDGIHVWLGAGYTV